MDPKLYAVEARKDFFVVVWKEGAAGYKVEHYERPEGLDPAQSCPNRWGNPVATLTLLLDDESHWRELYSWELKVRFPEQRGLLSDYNSEFVDELVHDIQVLVCALELVQVLPES